MVYIRDWRQTKDPDSRTRAFEMLRGLTYLQTVSGRNAGNVVLWMQPDGTLNPSAEPVELPDPSDSDASYWLARTVWALGEGYAAFKGDDPAFAASSSDVSRWPSTPSTGRCWMLWPLPRHRWGSYAGLADRRRG